MEWITLEKVFENWLENITKYHMHWPCLRMLMMLEFSRNETQINNHYYLTNRMANRVELTFWTHIRQGSRSLSFLFVIHPRSICARHIWDICTYKRGAYDFWPTGLVVKERAKIASPRDPIRTDLQTNVPGFWAAIVQPKRKVERAPGRGRWGGKCDDFSSERGAIYFYLGNPFRFWLLFAFHFAGCQWPVLSSCKLSAASCRLLVSHSSGAVRCGAGGGGYGRVMWLRRRLVWRGGIHAVRKTCWYQILIKEKEVFKLYYYNFSFIYKYIYVILSHNILLYNLIKF